MFRQGELENLVEESGLGKVLESGYDHENWFVMVERT